jgi:hypothetical protein
MARRHFLAQLAGWPFAALFPAVGGAACGNPKDLRVTGRADKVITE